MRPSAPLAVLALVVPALAARRTQHLKYALDNTVDVSNASAAQKFVQVLDHFPTESEYAPHPPANTTFKQRWWYNIAHYKEGGPVIFQDPGEGPGAPYDVSEGYIFGKLAEKLGGIVLALEHRYFGDSYPFAKDNQTTDTYRFLTVRQAMADTALFAQTVEIPELKKKGIDITAPNTPWILYGGSYPGAKTAWTRVTYPDLFMAGIASSAVTHPQTDFWQYFDVARRYLPADCSAYLVSHVSAADRLYQANDTKATNAMDKLFGERAGTDAISFADIVYDFVSEWQSLGQQGVYDGSWNPSKGKYGSYLNLMCKAMTNTTISDPSADIPKALLTPLTQLLKTPDQTVVEQFELAGIKYNTTDAMINGILSSFVAWADTAAEYFRKIEGATIQKQDMQLEEVSVSTPGHSGDDGASWTWLVCNEFGYQQDAAPKDTPSVVSRYLSYSYFYKEYCTQGFPPGEFYKLPVPVNVSSLTAFGDFNIKIDNLIMIGGQMDPWRPVTPLADGNLPKVQNTTDSPAHIIPDAGHCFDFGEPQAAPVWKAPLKAVFDIYLTTAKGWLSAGSKRHVHPRHGGHAHYF